MVKNDYKAQEKYDKENTIRISLKLNVNTDDDILQYIDMKHKQTSIKKLLRLAIN